MSAIVLIGAGAVLLLAGVGLGFWLGTIGRKKEATKASDLQKELDDYRQEVTEHFNVTAEKFQTIGKEYRKLYDHMASGAAALCHSEQSGDRLEFPAAELIASEAQEPGAKSEEVVDSPPVDFELKETDEAPAEDAEATSVESTGAEAAEVEAEAIDVEPSDEELLETETAEEILAEREISQDETEAGKTIH